MRLRARHRRITKVLLVQRGIAVQLEVMTIQKVRKPRQAECYLEEKVHTTDSMKAQPQKWVMTNIVFLEQQ
jgi:spore coat polysaccharide biosynthesis protein SpsF (cytidylyltransferase family)